MSKPNDLVQGTLDVLLQQFYTLTRLGRKQLESETANWRRRSSATSQIVQLSEA